MTKHSGQNPQRRYPAEITRVELGINLRVGLGVGLGVENEVLYHTGEQCSGVRVRVRVGHWYVDQHTSLRRPAYIGRRDIEA